MILAYSVLIWFCECCSRPEPGLMSSTSPAVLPSLFLHFTHPGGSDEGDADSRMLQIVTKQAHLVDALMQTCVRLIQSGGDPRSSKNIVRGGNLAIPVASSLTDNLDLILKFRIRWKISENLWGRFASPSFWTRGIIRLTVYDC